MVAKAVKMYSVKWYVNGVIKESPQISKPYSVCRWWVNQNKHNYKNGLLVIESVK